MPLAEREFIASGPKVYVIGVQSLNAAGLHEFLSDEGFLGWTTTAETPGEIIPEIAGRLCYISFASGREHGDYIENIKRDRHGSVLEHATVNFILTGVSRTFTHELVRHRVGWSYSQLSQRYVDESHAQIVCPAAIAACRGDTRFGRIFDEWHRLARVAVGGYRELVIALEQKYQGRGPIGGKLGTFVKKLVRGAARSVLPGATETKIACTANARSLRHFLEMRASVAADLEIRQVALAIYRAVLPFWPDILGDYTVAVDEFGDEYLTTPYVKV